MAYRTIGEAVGDVRLNGPAEIWVAEGVYNERVTLVPFAHMYGGFAGTESERSERDWRNNVTVIDGSGTGNVVNGVNISRIDGFTIRTGQCGIHCSAGFLTITNNTMVGNSDYGVYCDYRSSPTITGNRVVGNWDDGIRCSDNSSPTITNNTIAGNYRDGMYCSSDSPTITNNTIAANSRGITCSSGSAAITNNTIVGNSREGIFLRSSSDSISDNIVAFNGTGVYGLGGMPVLSHNDVYGNSTDYDSISPGAGDISVDPEFACWEQWDFHIQPTSPCRDAGDDAAPGLPTTDMDGQARDDGGGVDIGADESYGEQWPPCPSARIVYVDGSASPGGDGTSWAMAYRTIDKAVDDVRLNGPAEIWAAEGVYVENVTLVMFGQLYGGFAGTEKPEE